MEFKFCFLLVAVAVARIGGQSHTNKPSIYSLHIRSDIQFRFATTLITSRVANPANHSREAVFTVDLPGDAFITKFQMEIDGVIYPGIVERKETAKKKFEAAKKKGQSTGLVRNWPPDSSTFTINVNVAALSKVTFNLTYQELLQRSKGFYRHAIFVNPGQPVDDLQITVAILETQDIRALRVPPVTDITHGNRIPTEDSTIAVINRLSSRSALIHYVPSFDHQKAKSKTGIKGHFIVEYDVAKSSNAGDMLILNGYFVHFLSPEVADPIPRDVLFVLDQSGSMYSDLDQVKEAVYHILDDLQEDDSFNFLMFNSGRSFYNSNHAVRVTRESIRKAKEFIRNQRATGGTNINGALTDGVMSFRRKTDRKTSSVIVFLTDGQPTSGVTRTEDILANIRSLNKDGEVPIFGLAFGNHADWNLVKMVSIQNNGFSRIIYPESNGTLQITGFYDEMAATLLNNVTVQYPGNNVNGSTVTRTAFRNYYSGSEMIVAGKLENPDTPMISLEVSGDGAAGGLKLSRNVANTQAGLAGVTGLMEVEDFQKITEKLWAYLTIKQLLDGTLIEQNATVRAEMKKKALQMSLKYGFVTPLTSMVVTKPEEEVKRVPEKPLDTVNLKTPSMLYTGGYQRSGKGRGGGGGGGRGGGGGGGGGGYSGGGGGDPHYMMRIRGMEYPVCFDVSSKAGEIYNLITDPVKGIRVYSHIIESDQLNINGEPKTFIGTITIRLTHHNITVTPEDIMFDKTSHDWKQPFLQPFGQNDMLLSDKGKSLLIRFSFGTELHIIRHLRHTSRGNKTTPSVDFLNIYVKHEDLLSRRTSGLIGHFGNGHRHITMKKQFVNEGGKTMGKFLVKGFPSPSGNVSNANGTVGHRLSHHVIRGNLVERPDVMGKGKERCWMIHKPFEQFLFGKPNGFVVKGTF